MAFSGGGAAGQARRLLPPREARSRAQARRVPRRRVRRRQDPPARGGLPRDAGPAEVLRLVHRVHRPRRRARLQEHRRAVPRLGSALHRRVRARRSRRHHGDDPAARRARGRRARGWPRHPTPLPTPWAKAASPRRTSCARSTRCPRASRRSASTAPTTATARWTATPTCSSPPQYEAAIADAATTGLASDDSFADLVAHLARVHPSRYIRIIDGLSVVGLRDVAPAHRPVRGAALRRVHRPRLRRASSRSGRPESRSTWSSPTRCSPAGTARSTCARSRGSSHLLSPEPSVEPARVIRGALRRRRNRMFTRGGPHVTNGKHSGSAPVETMGRRHWGNPTRHLRPCREVLPEMDQGNTAFILLAAALVLLMTPGLAFFYGGLVKAKSVISMMMLSFGAMGLIGVLWVLYGYAIAFPTTAAGTIQLPVDDRPQRVRPRQPARPRPRAPRTRRSPSSPSRRRSPSSPSPSSRVPSQTARSSARG